jgi:hypothetical protein
MEQQKHLVMTEDGRARLIVTRRPPNRVVKGVLTLAFVVLMVLIALGSLSLKASGAPFTDQGFLSLSGVVGLLFSAVTYWAVRICLPDEIEFRPFGGDVGQVIPKTNILIIAAVPNAMFAMSLIWVFLL